MSRSQRRRAPMRAAARAVAVVFALAAGLALTGCGSGDEAITQRGFDVTDGTSTDAGDVRLRNLQLVAADEEGGTAALIGAIANAGQQEDVLTAVTLQGTTEPAVLTPTPVEIPAGGAVFLGVANGPTVTLSDSEPPQLVPGAFVPVSLTFESAGDVTVELLVQAPVGEYATVTPAPLPGPQTTPSPTG